MVNNVIDAFKKYWPEYYVHNDKPVITEGRLRILLGLMTMRGATEEEIDDVIEDFERNYAP